MKLIIELDEDEARAFERDGGPITQEVELVELRQGLLCEQRVVSHIEAPTRNFFLRVGQTAKEADPSSGPWLTVYLGPDREEFRGNGDAGSRG